MYGRPCACAPSVRLFVWSCLVCLCASIACIERHDADDDDDDDDDDERSTYHHHQSHRKSGRIILYYIADCAPASCVLTPASLTCNGQLNWPVHGPAHGLAMRVSMSFLWVICCCCCISTSASCVFPYVCIFAWPAQSCVRRPTYSSQPCDEPAVCLSSAHYEYLLIIIVIVIIIIVMMMMVVITSIHMMPVPVQAKASGCRLL